jgi:hypothetical protein
MTILVYLAVSNKLRIVEESKRKYPISGLLENVMFILNPQNTVKK